MGGERGSADKAPDTAVAGRLGRGRAREDRLDARRTSVTGTRGLRGRRTLAVVGATAADLVIWALAHPMGGIALKVRLGGSVQTVGPGTVAAAGLIAGLAAWALLASLERITQRPGRAWTIAAVVGLAVSLTGPLSAATTTASMVTLAAMHLILAAVLIPGLGRSTPRR